MLGKLIFVSLIVVCSAGFFNLFRKQHVAARGQLFCHGIPQGGVRVKLYDVDTFDPDDLLGETRTDFNGYFEIMGHTREFSDIEPQLNIYHHCENRNILQCPLKLKIRIPYYFVTVNTRPTRAYTIGGPGILPYELAYMRQQSHLDCLN